VMPPARSHAPAYDTSGRSSLLQKLPGDLAPMDKLKLLNKDT